MFTALPVPGCPEAAVRSGLLPGRPWSVRVAGAESPCPALELFEAGALLDVVSSTRLAARLLRGGRAADTVSGPRALAWGRLPASGAPPGVEFSRGGLRPGRLRRTVQLAAAIPITPWCWLAAADGPFDRVIVRCDGRSIRLRLSAGR